MADIWVVDSGYTDTDGEWQGQAVAAFATQALANEFAGTNWALYRVTKVRLLDGLPPRVELFQVYGVHHSAATRVDTPEVWEVKRTTSQMVRTESVWDFEVDYKLKHGWFRTLAEAMAAYETDPMTRWEG